LYFKKVLKFIQKLSQKEDTIKLFDSDDTTAELKFSIIALKHLYNSKNLDVERMVTREMIKVRKE